MFENSIPTIKESEERKIKTKEILDNMNLKEYIKAGKDEMDKLMNEVKKLHGYLQNENFE